MSKFFEGLDGESKKPGPKAVRAFFEEESDEEKPRISNKEKRLEEITALCQNASFKKPKDVETFFKALGKYSGYFAREGLPKVVSEFLTEANVKTAPSVFKQRRAKFLEKYEDVTVILHPYEEKKEKVSYMDQINKALLEDNLEKRKQQLVELEQTPGLALSEQHRVNLYMIGCLIEESPMTSYHQAIDRLLEEKNLATTEEEANILKTRISQCVRKLVEHIAGLHAQNKSWQAEFNGLSQVAAALRSITAIPDKARLEIVYFMLNQSVKPPAGQAAANQAATDHYPIFQQLEQLRALPYPPALELYHQLLAARQSPDQEDFTDAVGYSKIAEELGHRAFQERDFSSAIDLLERAFGAKTLWGLPSTETLLNVLALCFEQRMKERPYFEVFKQNLQRIRNNLLLLKTETPKDEIARAFIFLRLGDYRQAEQIVNGLLPQFECQALLKARAMEILFADQLLSS